MQSDTTPCGRCGGHPRWRILKAGWRIDHCGVEITIKPREEATREQMSAALAKAWNDAQSVIAAANKAAAAE